jgi:hypothetical protein
VSDVTESDERTGAIAMTVDDERTIADLPSSSKAQRGFVTRVA